MARSVPVTVRRSQAERAEQMRARLLDATIDCLARSGYSEMSTNDVVRAAKVSRGALAHHYPTKTELVIAAARRLIDQRADDFRHRFSAIPPERRTREAALDVLWSFYDDPGAVAIIELTVAARHQPELQAVLAPVAKQLAANTADIAEEFFPGRTSLPFADTALRAIHALFAGLALWSMATPEDDGADVRTFLKLLVSLAPEPNPRSST